MKTSTIACVMWTVLAMAAGRASATDWPQWRGPENNGITRETHFSIQAIATPKVLWKANVGAGYSAVAVAGGRAFTAGWADGKDHIRCLDAATGKELWTHSYASPKFDKFHPGGTGSTPTIHDGRVYYASKQGDLFCLDAGSGKVQWHKVLTRDLGASVPTWGFSGSPIVEGQAVIVDAGVIAAFDRRSGKEIWRSEAMPAGYSTPVAFDHDGRRLVAAFTGETLVVLNAADGKIIARFPWKTQYDVNAATPIVSGDRIFISSGYGRGAALLRLNGSTLEKVWENTEMKNQMNPSVLIDGLLYGFDGNTRQPQARLACVEFDTGKARWGQPGLGAGALIAAVPKDSPGDAHLIAMSERGELVLVAADPSGYKELARSQVLGGTCWTVPVVSNGRIYCRNDRGDLVCLDAKAEETR